MLVADTSSRAYVCSMRKELMSVAHATNIGIEGCLREFENASFGL